MSRYVLFLESENRFITLAEVLAGLSMPSQESCGLVFADGIDGDRFRVRLGTLDDTVRFHDRQSALNAIRHLDKDVPRKDSDFHILCCEG